MKQDSYNEDLHNLGQDMKEPRFATPLEQNVNSERFKNTSTVARQSKAGVEQVSNGQNSGLNDSYISIDKVMEHVLVIKSEEDLSSKITPDQFGEVSQLGQKLLPSYSILNTPRYNESKKKGIELVVASPPTEVSIISVAHKGVKHHH